MITQTRKLFSSKVTAAKATTRGLRLCIDGQWALVDGKERFFEEGAVILLDCEESGTHFSEGYIAHFHGDPSDSAAPMDLHGGTTDPVTLCVVEHWLADHLKHDTVADSPIPVPTLEQARIDLPVLRARRHANSGKSPSIT